MLKKVIKYTDYNNVEQEKTFYFNISKGEFAEMELRTPGGLEKGINSIIANKDSDPGPVVDFFKKLITMSYGVKSDDGNQFVKSDALTAAFLQSEAYSELFFELVTNSDAAIAFFEKVIPQAPKQ